MTGTESTREAWKAEAYELGREAAENAASWTVEAGRYDVEAVRLTLRMMRDGDPAVFDYLPPVPNLSGEWADSLTPLTLYAEITGESYPDYGDGDTLDALADAYEQGVADHFEGACERELMRYAS